MDKYRLLSKGENIKEGDEYENNNPVRGTIGWTYDPNIFSNIRRKCKYIDV